MGANLAPLFVFNNVLFLLFVGGKYFLLGFGSNTYGSLCHEGNVLNKKSIASAIKAMWTKMVGGFLISDV